VPLGDGFGGEEASGHLSVASWWRLTAAVLASGSR
jgi:hypothetical protein